jgi:MFS family permease
MLNDSRTLIKNHGGLIFAGFLLFFFSIFGQSAIFGAYLPDIRADLGLTKTFTGGLYAAATIASGIAIVFTGRLLDYHRLRHVLAGAIIGLALGCFALASATGPVMLFVAFFLLRQCGQGLMVHSANTAINRYIDEGRGKAMAMILQGGPLHVVVFPPLAIWMAHYIDWRTAWAGYGLFGLFCMLPGFWFYLRRHQSTTHALWERRMQAEAEKNADAAAEKEWTRRHVVRDWRFYAMCSIFIIAPFVGTVLFFYQHEIADSVGITPLLYAATFPGSAFSMIAGGFIAGYVIDKYGEKPGLLLVPLLYTAGLLAIAFTHRLGLPVLHIGMYITGAAAGIASATGGPLIARLYGTKHLGGIKAMLFSVNILSSATSPFIFGFLMDRGHDITTLLSWVAYYTGVVWLMVFPLFATMNDNKKELQA